MNRKNHSPEPRPAVPEAGLARAPISNQPSPPERLDGSGPNPAHGDNQRTLRIIGDPDDPEGGTLWVNQQPIWLTQRQFLVVLALGEHLLRLAGHKVYIVIDTSSLFPSANKVLSGIQHFLTRLNPQLGVFDVEKTDADLRDQILAIRDKLEKEGMERELIRNGSGRFGYMLNALPCNITIVCPRLDASRVDMKRTG